MHTKPAQYEVCHVCGSKIEENQEAVLNECCSNQWIKQQIDNSYL
ncbi:hypothetical protein [Desmospora profundinema]|uniref:Uncharacterized protein n=1 Tax=Desmospora profundinema TaxID=1571184 RepID=A0ABU1IK99_9BACL|nr:hypothetical protein [Desmospora profundinema]MDR6225215.1 hypothetical protein [Desmospora profundinema]